MKDLRGSLGTGKSLSFDARQDHPVCPINKASFMPTIENHGIQIHYEVHGSGHPVVLVHGGTVSFKHNYADFGWIEALNDSGLQVIGQ